MAAARVAGGIFITRILGFIRERAMAHYLGTSLAADAFRAALRIPNVLRNLLGEGTLSASFIPVYTALEQRGDRGAARALAGTVLGILLAASGLLALLGIALAPAITTTVAAGFDEPTRRLTITLVRLLFPMTGLMVVSAWCLGVLTSHDRFFLPYVAPAVWNIAGIVALVAAATWIVAPDAPLEVRLHQLALALAWGTVAGSVLQVAVQLPSCWRIVSGGAGGVPLRLSLAPEGARDVVRAWTPLVLGAGVGQISALIDTQLGSFAGAGAVASLGYAQLLGQLPVSLFGVAVAAAALPALSRDAAGGEQGAVAAALRDRLADGFGRIAFFVVPSAFAFVALGDDLVALLFQTGRFGIADTAIVSKVLAAYGIGLLGMATVKLFASGFYAQRDTRTPVRFSIVTLVVSTVTAVALLPHMGPVGIALGSSVGALVNLVLQLATLDRRLGRVLEREDWRALLTTVAASLAACGAWWLAQARLVTAGPVVGGLAAIAIFGSTYLVLTLILGHPEARQVWTRLR